MSSPLSLAYERSPHSNFEPAMKSCAASPALVRVWNGSAEELERITIPRFEIVKDTASWVERTKHGCTTPTSKHDGEVRDSLS